VPAIVVSNLSHHHAVKSGPFEHASSLALIESAFGIPALTARDANARNLAELLKSEPRNRVPAGAIPTSDQVPGPANDAAAVCSASSVQSVSPAPVRHGTHPHADFTAPLARSGYPTGSGMAGLGKEFKKAKHQLKP
jgi:phospholipase C